MDPVAVVRDVRGEICENIHLASAVVSTKTGQSYFLFPRVSEHPVFLRSAAKPFQAVPLYQNPSSRNIPLEEWAVICASHAASDSQLSLVKRVLGRAGVPESALQCGPHAPFDEAMAKTLICQGWSPSAIHNNCSGKHAGMLLACRLYGWPTETYLDPTHPLQQKILDVIKMYSQVRRIEMAIDGCGAPVFALPLEGCARLFSRLAVEPELETIRLAMVQFPDVVGDPLRIDTQLMTVSSGRLLAKVGAEGFIGVSHLETGEGLALKMHDGSSPIRDKLIVAVLEQLGWLTVTEAESLWAQPQFSRHRLNTQGKVVGYHLFDGLASFPAEIRH